MIHEYALEPELVATWADRSKFRYFIEKFGFGQPRAVSRYPEGWKLLVWEAFRSDNDIRRARMTELLVRLSEALVQRSESQWTPDVSWLDNAQAEDARVPFHAILARNNPRTHPRVLIAEELDEAAPLWAVPHGRTTRRRATEMAAAVASMLRIADVIVFVDPHFGPENGRHRRPLQAFLQVAVGGRPCEPPQRVEVQGSALGGATEEFFREECRGQLPRCIPRGIQLSVVRLRQRAGNERLHNRYILTDLGGVKFGVGLDDGNETDTDDINLLDREQYLLRWRQYAGDTPVFDRPEPGISIEGTNVP